MGYCFYCDEPVDGDHCPKCGRSVWIDEPAAAPPLPQGGASDTPGDWPDNLPRVGTAQDAPRREIKPWMVAAAVVGVGLFLSILTIPSGFQHVTTPSPPPVTTMTTTTIPRPGATRPPYEPAIGTWIGLLRADAPPETLTGTFPFLEPALDVMPDGSLLTVTNDAYVRVTPDGGHTPLPIPRPDELLDIALSPNGRLLATADLTGHPSIWDLETGATTPLDEVSYSIPVDSASLRWAPDSLSLGLDVSGHTYYVWSAEGPLLKGPTAGRLIAVSRLGAVGEDDEGLRIDGGYHILAQDTISDITVGAFSPDAQYLAVDAAITDESAGVWLLSVSGPGRQLLAPSGSPFTWSGDGSALYWADATGIHAHPVGPESADTVISIYQAGPDDRLRVYDPALVPTPTLLVDAGKLFELRDSVLFRRDPDGLHLIDPPDAGVTTSIQPAFTIDPSALLLRTVLFDPSQTTADVLLLDWTGATKATLGSTDDGAIATVIDDPTLGVLLQTDHGEVLRVDPDGLTHVLSGTSLGVIGLVPFTVTAFSSIVTIASEGEEPTTLLEASDLPGARRILAAVGIRSELLVLTEEQTGAPAVFWVPGDSQFLRDVVLPNSPVINATLFSLVYTSPENLQVSSGRIVSAGDGQMFAVEMKTADAILTLIMADPGPGQMTCGGIVACLRGTVDGRTFEFSPDGSWLLVDQEGELWAVSTRGRGSVLVDIAAPDQIAWIPSSR